MLKKIIPSFENRKTKHVIVSDYPQKLLFTVGPLKCYYDEK